MTGIYTTTAPFILPGNPSWVWKTFTHNDTPYQAVVRLALEWGATAWDTSQAITRRNF